MKAHTDLKRKSINKIIRLVVSGQMTRQKARCITGLKRKSINKIIRLVARLQFLTIN